MPKNIKVFKDIRDFKVLKVVREKSARNGVSQGSNPRLTAKMKKIAEKRL